MSAIVGMDTATSATVAGVLLPDGSGAEARHDPAPGERPGHASRLLGLVEEAMERAGATWEDVGRIAVGVGPGTFTGLRIGVATARGLAHARGIELAGVSTLAALAAGAAEQAGDRAVLAVLDARRGEAFAAAEDAGAELLEPCVCPPAELAARAAHLPRPLLAVGEGAVRFRADLEPAGVTVPEDASPLHRVGALHVCRLGRAAPPADRDAVLPSYLRLPDAELALRARRP